MFLSMYLLCLHVFLQTFQCGDGQACRKRCSMAVVAAPKICRERDRKGREGRKERKEKEKREEKKERNGEESKREKCRPIMPI